MRNTWFIDIDGTIVHHKTNKELDEMIKDFNLLGTLEKEHILPGVNHFWGSIPENDLIILTTAREERHRWVTEAMLSYLKLRFDKLVMALGSGKRFVVNDIEPGYEVNGGRDILKAFSYNVMRDSGLWWEDIEEKI